MSVVILPGDLDVLLGEGVLSLRKAAACPGNLWALKNWRCSLPPAIFTAPPGQVKFSQVY